MDRLKQEIINVDDKVGNRKDFNCYALKILHQNVQSLSNKQRKLFIVLNTDLTNLDVLCFMEHCLMEKQMTVVNINLYKLVSNFSTFSSNH
jgi:hypothetical protein